MPLHDLRTAPEENRQREERFDKRLFDERQRLLTKVLHAMARTLNFKVEQLEIFEGGYTPQGWENEYVEHRLVRRFLIDLYGARVALPVMVFDPTHPIEPGIPANNGGTKVQAAEPPQAKAKH